MILLVVPIAFAVAAGGGPSDAYVVPPIAPAVAAPLSDVPRIAPGTKTITFAVQRPFVGQVCTHSSDGAVRLKGPAEILNSFGDERGGPHVKELTVLELRQDGKLQKLRYRVLHDGLYVSTGGVRQQMSRATRGQTYVLTREDDEGWFEAARADGSPISEGERGELRGQLDRRHPDVLEGRTMTLGETVIFSDEELRRYFAFEDTSGMKVKSHEMKLGAIDETTARIDVKIKLDLNSTSGEADVTAWATIHSDLALRRQITGVEGPVRLAVPGAINGLGAPSGPGGAGTAPQMLTGTFHLESRVECSAPPR